MIGAVGEQTQGVEKLLRRIGFRYAQRVDPSTGARTSPPAPTRSAWSAPPAGSSCRGTRPTFLTERVLVARRMPSAPLLRRPCRLMAGYRDARTLLVDQNASSLQLERCGPGDNLGVALVSGT